MKDQPKTLTPKLRFPEFRKSGGWKHAPLGSVLSEKGLQSDGKSEVHSVSLTKGVVPQIEHMGRSFSAADTSHYTLVRPFDVIYTKSPLAIFKLGIVKQHRGPHNALVSPLYGVFTPINRHVGQLIEAFFDSPSRSMRFLEPLCQKGAKNTIQISNDRFLSGGLFLPDDEAEQRKIAACLTSLDGLLAAEGRKLEALRAHKKGLMQQLFPREGESRPRLRFPEFRDAPEWKETRLGQLGKLVSGLTYSPADVRSEGLLVLRSSNIRDGEIALDDCVYVTPDIRGANIAKPNDILICVRNGSKPLIGKNALIPDGMPPCTHGAFMTVLRAKAPQFVFQLLQTAAYYKQVAADLGATINSINGSQLLKYRFVAPEPDEQQRIAACLSSLDALIAAQSRKLDDLRAHKTGLMQQLFPSPEGV